MKEEEGEEEDPSCTGNGASVIVASNNMPSSITRITTSRQTRTNSLESIDSGFGSLHAIIEEKDDNNVEIASEPSEPPCSPGKQEVITSHLETLILHGE